MKGLGIKGEDIAADYLKTKGYKIIARNYKAPYGEMDIIAKDGDTIVFVEVKTRASDSLISPYEAVDWKKKDKVRTVALHYISRLKKELPVRFDVVGITIRGDKKNIEHIKDAFEG